MEHPEISQPVLLRKRHYPILYEVGEATREFPETEQDQYRWFYYEAIDLTLTSVRERFDPPAFKVDVSMETLLLKAANREETGQEILKPYYHEDLNIEVLTSHLVTFRVCKTQDVNIKGHGFKTAYPQF